MDFLAFLEMYKEELKHIDFRDDHKMNYEVSLYYLLSQFKEDLLKAFDWKNIDGNRFHKHFRQRDILMVYEGKGIDNAIWNLLQSAPIFWFCWDAIENKKELEPRDKRKRWRLQ